MIEFCRRLLFARLFGGEGGGKWGGFGGEGGGKEDSRLPRRYPQPVREVELRRKGGKLISSLEEMGTFDKNTLSSVAVCIILILTHIHDCLTGKKEI